MAAYLKEKGLDGERILLEDKSTNTKENLAFSRELIGEGKRIVVVLYSEMKSNDTAGNRYSPRINKPASFTNAFTTKETGSYSRRQNPLPHQKIP